jgi:hypothetical protein
MCSYNAGKYVSARLHGITWQKVVLFVFTDVTNGNVTRLLVWILHIKTTWKRAVLVKVWWLWRFPREGISSCGKRWFVRSDRQGSRFFRNVCCTAPHARSMNVHEGTREYISCNSQRWSLPELGTEKLVQQERVKNYGSPLRLIGCLDDRGTEVRFPACARDLSLDRLWGHPCSCAVGTWANFVMGKANDAEFKNSHKIGSKLNVTDFRFMWPCIIIVGYERTN